MNICLVIISNGWGGAETVVYELARHLREKGEDVSIILNQEIIKYYENIEGVDIFNIGAVYSHKNLIRSIINPDLKTNRHSISKTFPWPFFNEILRYIYFGKIKSKISLYLLDRKIEIIHSHLENSHLLLSNIKNTKTPWVGTIHGPRYVEKRNKIYRTLTLKKWKAKNLKFSLYKMDKITFVSGWLLNVYDNVIPIKNKSMVIFNGIKVSEFQVNYEQNKKLTTNFNLLFPGGNKLWKGIDLLIDSLSKIREEIPNIHLYITRDVPKNDYIRQIVKDKNLDKNVTFTGFLTVEEYRTLLSQIDILVMPSRAEAFGIVFLEAMAMGKPIIASNNGGIPEFLVDGKNGYLIKERAELVYYIVCLYKNKELIKKIGQNNRRDVELFSWEHITEKYSELYKSLITNIEHNKTSI